jgi:hypothetical protein
MAGLLMIAGVPMNVWTPAERGGDALTRRGGTGVSKSIRVLQTIVVF